MSDARIHRQKLLNSFLAIIMILAVGAEIKLHVQSNAIVQSEISTSAASSRVAVTPKPTIGTQLAQLNTAELVTSRFLSPIHARITWTR